MKILKYANLEKIDDIFYHKVKSKNQELYDKMWDIQNTQHKTSNTSWGKNRGLKLHNMFGNENILLPKDASCLDACSGLGRFSIALREVGINSIHSFDGSKNGLKYMMERIDNRNIMPDINSKISLDEIKKSNFIPICADIENILDIFHEKSFNIIFHHMSLHHTKSWKKTIIDLLSILDVDGYLIFNFFTTNANPPECFDLRAIFLDKEVDFVHEFLNECNLLSDNNKKCFNRFKSILLNEKEVSKKFNNEINKIKDLLSKYTFDQICDQITFENMQTPYQHNIDTNEMAHFLKNLSNITGNLTIQAHTGAKVILRKLED